VSELTRDILEKFSSPLNGQQNSIIAHRLKTLKAVLEVLKKII
jgi:hypothetical protein